MHAQSCNYGLQKEYSVFHSPCNLRVEPQHMHIVHTAAELPACIRFSCCSPLASASAAARDCVRFVCCSLIASASTLLPDGVRFVCCSPIGPLQLLLPILVSKSAIKEVGFRGAIMKGQWVRAGLRPLRLLLHASCPGRFRPCPLFSNILRGVRGSKYEGRMSL